MTADLIFYMKESIEAFTLSDDALVKKLVILIFASNFWQSKNVLIVLMFLGIQTYVIR